MNSLSYIPIVLQLLGRLLRKKISEDEFFKAADQLSDEDLKALHQLLQKLKERRSSV